MSRRGQSGSRRPAPPLRPPPAPPADDGAVRRRADDKVRASGGDALQRLALGGLGWPRQPMLTDKAVDLLRTVINKTGNADDAVKVIYAISDMETRSRIIRAIKAVVLSLVSASGFIAIATHSPWALLPIYTLVGLMAIGAGIVVYLQRPLPGEPARPLPGSARADQIDDASGGGAQPQPVDNGLDEPA